MERRRQREIAVGAVAVLILGVAIYRIRTVSPDSAAGARLPQSGAAAPAQPATGPVTDVDLGALKTARPGPIESTRNPFRFKPKPPPAPPAPVRPVGSVQQSAPAGPAPPPRITLKFIGVLDSEKTGRVAVLSDGSGLPLQGKEGETILGRYRILKIGVESVDLAYVDGLGRQTIRLTGQ